MACVCVRLKTRPSKRYILLHFDCEVKSFTIEIKHKYLQVFFLVGSENAPVDHLADIKRYTDNIKFEVHGTFV